MLRFFILIFICVTNIPFCAEDNNQPFFNPETRKNFFAVESKKQLAAELANLSFLQKLKSNYKTDSIGLQTQKIYANKNGEFVWQDLANNVVSNQIPDLIEHLKATKSHGLNPEDFAAFTIDSLYQNLYVQHQPAPENEIELKAKLDALLTSSFLKLSSDLQEGSFKPSGIWEVDLQINNETKLLEKALDSNSVGATLASISPTKTTYKALQNKLQLYEKIAANGGWTKITGNLKLGSEGKNVEALSSRLAHTEDLAQGLKNSNKFNSKVEEGLKKFQERFGLEATGLLNEATLSRLNTPVEERIQTIKLNMERYRWLPKDLGKRHVWVNLPEYFIRVIENEDTVSNIVCVVGAPVTRTPILVNKEMINVIFSPTWTLPQSIAREEMEFILMNPAVLVVAKVDVWVDGKKVNPMEVDWKGISLSRVRMRQRPKQNNSMGKAKFMFKNGYSIYLHDTPNQHDFKINNRAQSHGCVRVGEPQELAIQLMKGSSSWNESSINRAMNAGKEQYAKLPEEVKVHLFYLTSWVSPDGQLQFRKDIYGHDRKQVKKMSL